MRTIIKSLLTVSFIWFCSTSVAQAALLGLVPDHIPDAKSWVSIDYTGNTTDGFHMDVDGFITSFDDGVGLTNPTFAGDCNGVATGLACYTLDADFDGNGDFLNGTINIAYDPTHVTAGGTSLTSGDLVTGDLTAFGFDSTSPHSGGFGLFEYSYDITSGDYNTVWFGANGGTIIDIRGLLDAAGSATYSNPINTITSDQCTWDQMGTVAGCAGPKFMTTEFHALLDGSVTADTFIPVPAAVWLFGSGLMAIGAVARRRRPGHRA